MAFLLQLKFISDIATIAFLAYKLLAEAFSRARRMREQIRFTRAFRSKVRRDAPKYPLLKGRKR